VVEPVTTAVRVLSDMGVSEAKERVSEGL